MSASERVGPPWLMSRRRQRFEWALCRAYGCAGQPCLFCGEVS